MAILIVNVKYGNTLYQIFQFKPFVEKQQGQASVVMWWLSNAQMLQTLKY